MGQSSVPLRDLVRPVGQDGGQAVRERARAPAAARFAPSFGIANRSLVDSLITYQTNSIRFHAPTRQHLKRLRYKGID
jgi:hypothetical protein